MVTRVKAPDKVTAVALGPKGDPGTPGAVGATPSIGLAVTMISPGSQPAVTVAGPAAAPVFTLQIPQAALPDTMDGGFF